MSAFMNNRVITTVAVVAIIGAGAWVYQLNHPAPAPAVLSAGETPGPEQVAISEVASGKAVLIDVRRDDEWAAGHAKNAVHFAVERIQAGELPDVAKDAKVYLYCHSGRRAGLALPILQQAGFSNVTNLGALQSWIDAGGPQA
jgi:rhodanese-related sulfurtransferase